MVIASAGEALEIEGLRYDSQECAAASSAVEQQRKSGHFGQFCGGLRHNPRPQNRLYPIATFAE